MFHRSLRARRLLALVGIAALALIAAAPALATPRDYTLITNQSSIAISGNVMNTTFGAANIQEQGPGSLTTTYSGTIKTDRVASTIAFLSGSNVDANVSGNWQPLADGSSGSAPADYGGMVSYAFGLVTARFAGRDLVAGVTSDAIGIANDGSFDLSPATVTFASGNIAYRVSTGSPVGSEDFSNTGGALSGSGAISSSFQGGLTTETVTFPVSASFTIPLDATTTVNLTLTGQLTAAATFPILLPGDYNENGVVDAADYVVWRDNLGSSLALANDDTAGVGADDYARWQANFGATAAGSAVANLAETAVPEPAALLLIACAAGIRLAQHAQRRTACRQA